MRHDALCSSIANGVAMYRCSITELRERGRGNGGREREWEEVRPGMRYIEACCFQCAFKTEVWLCTLLHHHTPGVRGKKGKEERDIPAGGVPVGIVTHCVCSALCRARATEGSTGSN